MPYAPTILTNAQVIVGTSSADISDHVTQAVLTERRAIIEDSRMGSDFVSRVQATKDWLVTLDIINDFASTGANLDATLMALACSTGPFPIRVLGTSGAQSSDNPKFSGNVVLTEHSPVRGNWGELVRGTLPFLGAGQLSRVVTSS